MSGAPKSTVWEAKLTRNGDKKVGKSSPEGVVVFAIFRTRAGRALSKFSGRPGSDFGSILGGLLGAFSAHNFCKSGKIGIFGGIQDEMPWRTVFGAVFGRILRGLQL